MSQKQIKRYRKLGKKSRKKLAENVRLIHHEFIQTIKSYRFFTRLGIAWDILIKGK